MEQFNINLINIKEIYMHCAKAIIRSSLWDPSSYLAAKDFPTISRILNDQINSNDDLKNHQQEEQKYREQIDNFG